MYSGGNTYFFKKRFINTEPTIFMFDVSSKILIYICNTAPILYENLTGSDKKDTILVA
jgi:hypothetical protein